MEITSLYVGLYFLAFLLHLTTCKVENQNDWNGSINNQYHIQTDEGDERYFKYQTKSGQYRKEKRLQDGTVIGTYGWIDPNGYLRLRDYVADKQGYRIVKTKLIYVGDKSKDEIPTKSINEKFLSSENGPQEELNNNYIPRRPNAHHPSQLGHENSKASAPLLYSSSKPPLAHILTDSSSGSYNVQPQSDITSQYETNNKYSNDDFGIAQVSSSPLLTTSPFRPLTVSPLPPSNYYYSDDLNDNLFLKSTNPETLQVLAPPPPIYYTALPSNSREIRRNFITTDNVNNNNNNNRGYVGNDKEEEESPQPYDGISTVENGFRYFLPRHYHEETQRKDKEERVGSFGYIDPFGIRRVIYYNSSPGKGFVHKKNNRYVGFSATPYDPRPKTNIEKHYSTFFFE
ncbi:hypothetical protein Phum_PHUM392590 [Pediculus humanus corporis]|uniref:Structural constituent of cuticle n=1 Tax=Pediculus humanus subsp. corporis TaxID=121224 RepID=E0VR51_PEDHC|nr:uncharacterized protein Phum_PHUM392590 [Pediculus humanus corporis]EEB15857.1 hypothetical protein Phum_PHUM392590 [Pediculus humanus corporis]